MLHHAGAARRRRSRRRRARVRRSRWCAAPWRTATRSTSASATRRRTGASSGWRCSTGWCCGWRCTSCWRIRETPPRVVINEAIELARAYSGEEAAKFVNGVLDGVVPTLEGRREGRRVADAAAKIVSEREQRNGANLEAITRLGFAAYPNRFATTHTVTRAGRRRTAPSRPPSSRRRASRPSRPAASSASAASARPASSCCPTGARASRSTSGRTR